MRYRFWICFAACLILGVIFLSSGIGKVLGQGSFLLSLNDSSIVPGPLVDLVGNLLPWLEILLGLCLVAGLFVQLASLLSAILIVGFIFQNTVMIIQGFGYEPCSCFGFLQTVLGSFMSTRNALIADIVMLVLAIGIYFLNQDRLLDYRPRFFKGRKSSPVTDPPSSSKNSPQENG